MLIITIIAGAIYLLVPASSEIALLTSTTACLVDTAINLRFREVKLLAQSHTGSKNWSWDSNPVNVVPSKSFQSPCFSSPCENDSYR